MKRLSLFEKSLAALGFATFMGIFYVISQAYLREANFQLVNPWVTGLSYVVGYYEPIIIGVPLIGGFLVGVTAVWFYTETEKGNEAQQKEEQTQAHQADKE